MKFTRLARGALTLALALIYAGPRVDAAPEVLDFTACLKEAHGASPVEKAARAGSVKAAAQVDAGKAAFLPQVSAVIDATGKAGDGSALHPDAAIDQRAAALADPTGGEWATKDTYSYGLSVKQSLFSGFRDKETVAERRAELEAANAAVDQTAAQLDYDLASAFYQQLYAQQFVVMQQDVAQRRQEDVRLVSLRYEGGRENQGAVLKSQATLKQAELDLEQAKRQLAVTRAALARLLGRQHPGDFLVKGSFTLPQVPPLGDVTATSRTTPEHRAADAALRAKQAAVNVAYGERYPDIAATAGAVRTGSWPPGDNQLSFGLTLSLPLYTGGALKADIRSAAADQAKADADLLATDLTSMAGLVQAHAALQDAVAKVAVENDFVKAAELQAEIGRKQYSLGLITFQDWDLLESALIDAQRSLLASRKDAVVAAAAWSRARGIRLAEAVK